MIKNFENILDDFHRENCVLLNSVQDFTEIEASEFFPMFTQSN